jgi:hypothetical protein
MLTGGQLVRLYEQGNITENEFCHWLAMNLSEDTAAETVDSLPPDLLEGVKKYVEACPHTEADWARLLWIHIGTYVGLPTKAESEAREAEVRRRLRHGVEILRDAIAPASLGDLDPAVRAWNDQCVVRLARGIKEERAFDRLPVLADAVEEAGAVNASLVAHLRGSGPHFRVCWALRAILGEAES